ncbi:MAG TPA: ABC transporter permease [Opitutaceae bacterium]
MRPTQAPVPGATRSENTATALLLGPGFIWLLVLFAAPIAIVVVVSLARRGMSVEWAFDFSAYARARDPIMARIVWRSFLLGVMSTGVCAVVGYPLTYFIVRRTARVRYLLYFLVLIPLTANSLVLIYAWITLLRPTGLIEHFIRGLGLAGEGTVSILYTPWAVGIGLTYWYLPFMVYPLYASMERFDFRLLEAAADLGANRFQSFWRVLLPQTVPGLATGCLLVFVQTFCSFVVPDLLGGSKTLMLGSFIQQRFLNLPQDWPLGGALAMLMIVVLGMGVWAVGVLQRREG